MNDDFEACDDEDPTDSEQADYFAGGGEPDDELAEEVVVPSWKIPGMDSYLRSLEPVFKQLSDLSGAADAIEKALSEVDLPKLDLPALRRSAELTRSIAEMAERQLAPVIEAMKSMTDWSRLVDSFVDPALFDRVRDLVARRMPPNWSEVEDWRSGTTLMEDSGWAIVWLPRSTVVLELLGASEDERASVLISRSEMLIEDAIACAEEVQHPELEFLGGCVVEIAESIREGRYRAAQALSASVLTELIQGVLGVEKLAKARVDFDKPWEDQNIQLLRFALITSTIPRALSQFHRERGDPIPSSFNRHAVAHGASPIQFTNLNALVGLLLVASLTRELQDLYDEGLLPGD